MYLKPLLQNKPPYPLPPPPPPLLKPYSQSLQHTKIYHMATHSYSRRNLTLIILTPVLPTLVKLIKSCQERSEILLFSLKSR